MLISRLMCECRGSSADTSRLAPVGHKLPGEQDILYVSLIAEDACHTGMDCPANC